MATDATGGGSAAEERMTLYRYIVVALCCMINMADGFDVVSLAYAAPLLTDQWAIDPAILGLVFGAASVGLAVGAFLIAPVADRVGRRPVMLACLGTLAAALLLTAVCSSIYQMLVLRFVTGCALGTLVVNLNVSVSEYSTAGTRSLLIALMHMGFTFGMILGSGISALVLDPFGWRAVFVAAGLLNCTTFVLSVFLLGESPAFLVERRPRNALARLNRLRRKFRLPPLAALPPRPSAAAREPMWRALLGPAIRRRTILIWIVSITYAIVGYFLLNWKPTVLTNAGLSPTLAAASGIVTGVCGAFGHLAMGWFARRIDSGKLTAIFFAFAAITLTIFGVQPPEPISLIAMAGATTFFVVGAYTGIFLVSIDMYPPAARNTGVGFVVGFGRVGAVIGPMMGGFLMSAGLDRMDLYFVFSAVAVIPAVTMYYACRRMRPAGAQPTAESVAG